jgi:hypothetical protein
MKKILLVLSLLSSMAATAECVHEKTLLGSELSSLKADHEVFIDSGEGIFKPLNNIQIDNNKTYQVQLLAKQNNLKSSDPHSDYNKKYLEYYTYARMQKYLTTHKSEMESLGLNLSIVGKSLEGRDLYSVSPKKLLKKKTILMFGRHHGDEGTANWIIEGFFNEYLANKTFRDEYQLILYPMVNPDGAEAHTRYNANNRDLNRSWHKSLLQSYDEVKIIHSDLKDKMKVVKDDIFVALDMHGSFTEDFIYRVKRNYVDRAFYEKQQEFIDELKIFDSWQDGNSKKSNGDKAMARIVFIDHYKKNAMTHESIRNIEKNNPKNRSLISLKDQGLDIIKVIQNLY